MTSRPDLEAYLALRDLDALAVVAEVELWGHIAGPAHETGDPPGTVRGQFAALATCSVSAARERHPARVVAPATGSEGRERGRDSFPAQTGLHAADHPTTEEIR